MFTSSSVSSHPEEAPRLSSNCCNVFAPKMTEETIFFWINQRRATCATLFPNVERKEELSPANQELRLDPYLDHIFLKSFKKK